MMKWESKTGIRMSGGTRPQSQRQGSLLFEAVAALAMLGVTMSLAAQMIVQVDRQAGLRREQECVSRLLQNEMERIVARPWESITSEALTELELPEEVTQWNGAELTAAVQGKDEPIKSRRVTLTLAWSPMPGADPRSLSLTAFVHEMQETKP